MTIGSTGWRARRLVVLVAAGLIVAACGDSEDDASGGEPQSCTTADLPLVSQGRLTVGTDSPAYPPWFQDDDPANGEGFESAVAYAVAEELGFEADQVTWTVVPFNNAFAPGEKQFDFDINQVSISEERDEAVDFSTGYYDVNQAIVGFSDSPAAGAATLDDVRSLRLGAQVGTTSLDFVTDVVQPETDPLVYNDTNAAKAALDAQQVDAIVLDLPTAFYVSAAEMEGTEVIGQFPAPEDAPEQFGLVFEEGNPLRACVNEALDRLRESGRLDEIEQRWLSEVVDAPVIPIG